MSDAPTELWADWDYDANDGVCGVHTHKKYASGYEPDCPPIRYVRSDRIEELDDIIRHDRERIEELVSMVESKADRIEELEAKLAKLARAAKPFAAIKIKDGRSQPGEIGRTDVTNLRAALAELKGEDRG
jgi:predicted RNase H-like nuclease (RuvC/YqgF family)